MDYRKKVGLLQSIHVTVDRARRDPLPQRAVSSSPLSLTRLARRRPTTSSTTPTSRPRIRGTSR